MKTGVKMVHPSRKAHSADGLAGGVLAFVLMSAPVLAGLPTKLFTDGEPLPGDASGYTVEHGSIRSPVLTADGGLVVRLDLDPPPGDPHDDRYVIWGRIDPNDPLTTLRANQTIGPYVQSRFWADLGVMPAGELLYTGRVDDTGSGATALDSLWSGDTLLLLQGQAVPGIPGGYWQSLRSAWADADGDVFWRGKYADANEAFVGIGLFTDVSAATPLVLSGDIIPGLVEPVAADPYAISGPAFSDDGAHWLAEVRLDTGETSTNQVLVMDGGPAQTASGATIREGEVVPVADGGREIDFGGSIGLCAERWRDGSVQYLDVNDRGDWVLSGKTDFGPGAPDDDIDNVLVHNGRIVHHEGDLHGEDEFAGTVLNVAVNNDGDVAFQWDLRTWFGYRYDALFLNGVVVVKTGTPVDLDGDGQSDGGLVRMATATRGLALSDRDAEGYVTLTFIGELASNVETLFAYRLKVCELQLDMVNPQYGQVELSPAAWDADAPAYPRDTEVTLTATAIEDKRFKHWEIYDPNHPGDANHATIDANNPITLVLTHDTEVTAVFQCGSGAGYPLPLLMSLCALAWLRATGRGYACRLRRGGARDDGRTS